MIDFNIIINLISNNKIEIFLIISKMIKVYKNILMVKANKIK